MFFLRIGLVLVVMFATGIQVSQANVKSMSLAKKSTNEQGVVQQQVKVKCSSVVEPKVLIKIGDQPWCDSQVTSLCSKEKLDVAKNVCSSRYRSLLQNHLAGKNSSAGNPVAAKPVVKDTPAPVAKAAPVKAQSKGQSAAKAKPANTAGKAAGLSASDLAAKQQELLDIEQQRVQIRQRQLELRKRELELQKQQVSAAESGF